MNLQSNPALRPPLLYADHFEIVTTFFLARTIAHAVIFYMQTEEPRQSDHPVNTANFLWHGGDSINAGTSTLF